jgi:hypothetical protein
LSTANYRYSIQQFLQGAAFSQATKLSEPPCVETFFFIPQMSQLSSRRFKG